MDSSKENQTRYGVLPALLSFGSMPPVFKLPKLTKQSKSRELVGVDPTVILPSNDRDTSLRNRQS